MISYNKGQCNERLAQAVWARVIARRRLAREVGSDKRRRRVPASTSTRLEAAAGEQRRSGSRSNQTTFLTRDVPPKQSRQYHCRLQFKNATIQVNQFQSINQLIILDNCFLNLSGHRWRPFPEKQWHFHKFLEDRREK